MIATEQQWDFILEKYEKLIWKICHRISGDNAIANLEDNYQDLCIAALDAIRGFEKKTGEKAEDFLDTILFGKYLKTCLWNHKNNKGAKIAKKYPLTKGTVSVFDNEEVLNLKGEDGGAVETSIFFSEIKKNLDEEQQECMKILLEGDVFHSNGKINISRLARKMDIYWVRARKIVDSIAEVMNNDL